MKKKEECVCFHCIHYEACQAWNIGSLMNTDATHCVNYTTSWPPPYPRDKEGEKDGL